MKIKLKQKVKVTQLKERLVELYNVRAEILELWQRTKLEEIPLVKKSDVAAVVARMTGIPLEELTEEEKEKLINLETRLHERIVGQNQAVELVSSAIRRSRVGLKDGSRPIGSFMFLGPTGVGKSELSKALAEVLYGADDMLVRMDMSEYMEKHTVSRLIGAPPGYIGYDEGGQLTEIVRRRPFSIILFDEIEKAHPEVFNILLQVMEDGRLTDGHGHLVDFKNCIIIMTSNVGSETIYETTLGFGTKHSAKALSSYEELKVKMLDTLHTAFKPEFLNRIDEVVVFQALNREDIWEIAIKELEKVVERLEEQGIRLHYGKKVIAWVVEKGYDPQYGARPIKRFIRKAIENPLSDEIIKGSYKSGDTIRLGIKEKNLVLVRGAKGKKENGKKGRNRKN